MTSLAIHTTPMSMCVCVVHGLAAGILLYSPTATKVLPRYQAIPARSCQNAVRTRSRCDIVAPIVASDAYEDPREVAHANV
jgi:hypothetical protein